MRFATSGMLQVLNSVVAITTAYGIVDRLEHRVDGHLWIHLPKTIS